MSGLKGYDDVASKLRSLQRAARQDVVAAVRANAQIAAGQMRSDVPVDTGELRDSIKVENNRVGATVTADAEHAWFVEHGTFNTPAQPFFEPAIEWMKRANKAAIKMIMRNAAKGK